MVYFWLRMQITYSVNLHGAQLNLDNHMMRQTLENVACYVGVENGVNELNERLHP